MADQGQIQGQGQGVQGGGVELVDGPIPISPTTGQEIIMSGYLSKKTRDGRWQKRFFETHGYYLTYYKSKKKEKILAALGLPQVGQIRRVPAALDAEGKEGLFELELNTRWVGVLYRSFTLTLAPSHSLSLTLTHSRPLFRTLMHSPPPSLIFDRIYTLRAKTDGEAEQWVKVLTKLREQGQAQVAATAAAKISGSDKSKSLASKQEGLDGQWEKDQRKGCCCSCS